MNNCTRSPLLMLDELESPFSPEKHFGRKAPLELEIGAGRGDFLLAHAPRNPGTDFIGVERSLVIVRRAVSKLERVGVKNAVFVSAEISYLLREYFTPGSFGAVHIYFPDPWPKQRHVKRRLMQPDNLYLIASTLRPGGALHLRTDVEWYFQAMAGQIAASGRFAQIEVPPDVAASQTGFELRFRGQGKPIYAISFRLL